MFLFLIESVCHKFKLFERKLIVFWRKLINFLLISIILIFLPLESSHFNLCIFCLHQYMALHSKPKVGLMVRNKVECNSDIWSWQILLLHSTHQSRKKELHPEVLQCSDTWRDFRKQLFHIQSKWQGHYMEHRIWLIHCMCKQLSYRNH